MREMTSKRLFILAFIGRYKEKTPFSPTYREMARSFGVSRTTVFEHVSLLVKTGHLTKQAPYYKGGRVQGLFLTTKGLRAVNVYKKTQIK